MGVLKQNTVTITGFDRDDGMGRLAAACLLPYRGVSWGEKSGKEREKGGYDRQGLYGFNQLEEQKAAGICTGWTSSECV